VCLFAVWLLLVWPLDAAAGGLRGEDVAAGAVVALLCVVVMRRLAERGFRPWLNPMRYVWLVVYGVVLAASIVKANVDVAYRVLHPAMPIRPGIVKVRTRLRSASAITVLANSVTLTPGTLTVSATADGVLYIHWIWVRTTDVEEASRRIIGMFEWFIMRIWE
jgi:multicomponent Na+:H+ antiporter subunit E